MQSARKLVLNSFPVKFWKVKVFTSYEKNISYNSLWVQTVQKMPELIPAVPVK